MTHTVKRTAPDLAPAALPPEIQGQMTRLLDDFVADTAGVVNALLVSRDGLKQAWDTKMATDWADRLAAGVCGLAALARDIEGHTGGKAPVQQVLVEREDTLFLITHAGQGHAFTGTGRTVATVLVILAEVDANVGTIGFEAARLVRRFDAFMTTPVRTPGPLDGAA